ncbi:MAG: hypothetical protein AAFR21_15940 [Pseudomonadota bacterium]
MIDVDRTKTLLDALPDDFSRNMVEGALRVASDTENAMRAHFFAGGWRELMNHVLRKFAPHKEVRACDWFEQVAGTNGITRRQRARYATQGGLSDAYLAEIGVDVSDLHDEALSAIEALNAAVHVQEGQSIEGDEDIAAFVERAISAFEGLLHSFAHCREAVVNQLRNSVYDNTMRAFVEKTFDEIDLISSHGYEVDPWLTIEEIDIVDISATALLVKVAGEAPVTLHYGRGNDAVATGHSFPFTMTFSAPLDALSELTLEAHEIDDSSWYGVDEEVSDDPVA